MMRKTLNLLLFLALPGLVVVFFSYLNRNFQMDDALIYLRYIRNFQDGLGLVYNPGERFNGLTSPLYMAALLAGSFFTGDLQLLTIWLSALGLLGASLIGARLWSRSDGEAICTAVLVAGFSYFYWNFGMETSLFVFLIGLTLWFYQRGSPWFVLVAALVAITRIEGILLGGVLGLDYLIQQRRLPSFKYLIPGFVLLLLPFIFNYVYFGHALAETGAAKVGQGRSGLWGEGWIFLNIVPLLGLVFKEKVVAAVLFILFGLYGIYSLRANRSMWLALIFAALLFAVYTGFNVPSYNWYYAPFFYLAVLLVARGFWQLASPFLDGKFARLDIARALLSLVCLLLMVPAMLNLHPRGALPHYRNIGEWIARNTPEDSSIGLIEIGSVGWYSKRRIIDILGLVTPLNAEFVAQRKFHQWLMHYRPDYILRHKPIYSHEQSISLLEELGAYRSVDEFQIPGFVLLQNNEAFPQREIDAAVVTRTVNASLLEELAASSAIGAPYVVAEPGRLFVHPPTELTYTAHPAISRIELSYGLDPEVAGQHFGVCFEILLRPAENWLLSDCIEQDASAAELTRDWSAELQLEPGDQLVFRTSCPVRCDYAWAYWRDIQLH